MDLLECMDWISNALIQIHLQDRLRETQNHESFFLRTEHFILLI